MPTIVKLFDENALLCDLQNRTIELIHATDVIDAIKKLTSAYDVISLNLDIQEKFKKSNLDMVWDLAALKDLNRTRIELLLYYRLNFNPLNLIDQYNGKLISLFRLIQLKNNFDF